MTRPCKQVGDDGENHGAHHAAEQSGDNAAQEQHMKGRRQRAQRGSRRKADVKEQQQLLAIEAIGKARREDPRNARAERIGRNRDAELRRGDVQRRHDDGAERRHDHEVQNDRELDKRQQRNQRRLIPRKAGSEFLLMVNRRDEGLFGHDTHSKESRGCGGGCRTGRP
jgi:hypothetical protein